MVLEEKQVGPMREYYFQAKLAMLGRLLQGWVALGQDLRSRHAELLRIPDSCCLLVALSLSSFSSISTGALTRSLALPRIPVLALSCLCQLLMGIAFA